MGHAQETRGETDFDARLARIKSAPGYRDALVLDARPDPRKHNKRRLDREISWEIVGYPGAVLAGIVGGFGTAVILVPDASFFTQPLDNTNLFGETMMFAMLYGVSGTAAAACSGVISVLMGWKRIAHVVLSSGVGYLVNKTSPIIVDYCRDTVFVALPGWLTG